jgi:hypothetical protein
MVPYEGINDRPERMQLSVSQTTPDRWVDKIRQFSGNLFHSREWADTRLSGCSRPLFFELRDEQGSCHGIAVGIESWSPARLVGRFSSLLEFETYPVVTDDRPDLVQAMVRRIVAYGKQKGCRRVAFQSYLSRTSIPQSGALGLHIEPRLEFVLDLSLSDSQLLGRFNAHHKRKIKKALKHDLQFKEAADMDAMQQFRRLQVDSRDRRLSRGEDMTIMDDAYYETLGRKYFAVNLGKVFTLNYQGRPVSAAFVALYAGRALYMYGGSSDLGFEKDAPPLLFKYIFARCRELGCREFNLGGVPAEAENTEAPSHGLYRFKAGFGGAQIRCENAYADNLNPRRDMFVSLAKRFLRNSRPRPS